MHMINSNVSSSRQWKYRELDSNTSAISKIISSNIVSDNANVVENIN